MPKLPVVSGPELVRVLQRLGFQQVSQRGSHAKLRRGTVRCVVPLHRELKKGTLSGILADAEIGIEDFRRALSH
jgi:predicted RNA binding protein YcfA (HicA-like mRNA interferase family)